MLKKRYLFLIMIVCLFAISAVSAEEIDNDTNIIIEDYDSGLISESVNEDTLSVSLIEDEIIGSADKGSFTDLQKKIDDAGEGAVIYLENDYVTDEAEECWCIVITKSLTIIGNGHTIDGNGELDDNGGHRMMYISSDATNVLLKNMSFINRQGPDINGVAILSYSNNLTIDSCNFDNFASDYSGNGVVYSTGVLTVIGSNFTNDHASDYGGAIYSTGNLTVVSSSFTNNSAVLGSAIYSSSNILIDDCIFVNNFVSDNYLDMCGGTIYSSGDLTVSNSIFIGNSAVQTDGFDIGYGGAIYSDGVLTVVSSNFTNNSADLGGAIYSYSDLTVSNSIFIGNSAVPNVYFGIGYGGAIYSDGVLTVVSSNFTNNSADLGGAIYSSNLINLSDSSFMNNTAKYGEAIAAYEFNINIDNCTFIDNNNFLHSFPFRDLQKLIDDADEGTVINLENDYDWVYDKSIKITKSITINGNGHTIDGNGEGEERILYISSDATNVLLKNMSFINCQVWDEIGGAIHSDSSNLTIEACNFDNISSGAIYSTGVLTVIGSNFTNDHAGEDGGAIYSTGVLTVIGSNFTNNRAYNGDAIYSYSFFDLSDSIFIINSYGNERTYHNVSKSVLKDKGIVVCREDYNILRCTLIEKGAAVNVNAPDVIKFYGGSERFVVTLKNDYGNPVANADVKIHINGVDYTRTTNSEGVASMALGLPSNIYDVTTTYGDVIVESKVTIKNTVFADDFTKMYKNGTQYQGTFIDTLGRTLPANSPVEININGVFYTRYTDDKGVARMNINLNPGTYVLTAKNPETGEMQATKITVIGTIVEVYDLTKYYKNESKLTFKLLDNQGRPVGAGVSANININGVFYTRQTNASGYVNMNINLNPGTYIATLDYNGLMASSTVTVLPILEAKDVVMKYRDGTKFEAKLLDGQGKPFAGQSITFNINGVFYNRPTDENGIARLAINLMAGEYIITSMYEPNGAAISNTVTILS